MQGSNSPKKITPDDLRLPFCEFGWVLFDVVEEIIASFLIFGDNVVAGFGFKKVINFYDFRDMPGFFERYDFVFVPFK